MSKSKPPAADEVTANPPDADASAALTRNFGGMVEHLSSAADHDVDDATVKHALAPGEAHVTRGSVVRDVLNGFLAGVGGNTKGINFMLLAKIAALALQGWRDGKSVGEIIKEIVAAFLAGTL